MYKYISILALTLISSVGHAQETKDDFQDELYAVNDTVKNKKGEVLKEVVIISQQQKTIVKGGKTNIKPLDLPQATFVIGKETIKQQQILRLSDALKNANGVYVSGASNASGNNQEELGSRGFTFSGGNTFKNGVRFNGSLIPETSSLESIEILKGSSALLYGNVAPGGILNLITKKPRFDHGGELSFRTTEYNFFKPTVDVYGSVNNSNTVAYRFISSYEQGNSFRNDVQTDRIYFNPSILLDISAKTNIIIEADYTKDNRTPDFGLTTIDYKVVALPRNTFLGFNWGKFASEQVGFTTTINHDLNKDWQLKGIFSYQGYTTNLLSSLRPNAGINDPNNVNNNLVRSNGDWIRGVQKTDTEQDYSLAEIDLNGTFKTGKVKHSLLFGADADQSNTTTLAYKNINYYDKINIYNPSVIIIKNAAYANTVIPTMDKNTNTLANVKRAGIYFQDLIEVSTKFKVLAGLRYSYLENTSNALTFSTNVNLETKTNDNIISPKLGFVFQPVKTSSIFASYSDSFVLNTGTDRNLNALPNSTIDQYEVGIKNEFFKGHLVANLTSYLIDYGNLAQTDFSNGNTNTNIKELAGAYQSKGVEIDITGYHKGLRLIAGYSFNETKYTKSNIYNPGTFLRFSPKHTANASGFYTFENTKLKGLELGLQATFIGERLGGRLRPNNASTAAELARKPIPVDGFIQLDASVGYSIKDFTIRTKLSNLANVVSYYVYDDNTVTPIAPRMLTTTLSYKF
ncbi:TonB-dependent siderophore receptor [Flavobacterium paronense]|uniref:TonB-dependent siderophore receptor n=1 Tax=Flavobacterium paronense TaxID=1392775 RepID=A0ABV5GGQ9_9FLAO|nr:TonB-dependent siderophore receptor [Flavobacterium paronense]MDN3677204.1 TonB-dependent siderophore receptor [Flavobacterium paronense]